MSQKIESIKFWFRLLHLFCPNAIGKGINTSLCSTSYGLGGGVDWAFLPWVAAGLGFTDNKAKESVESYNFLHCHYQSYTEEKNGIKKRHTHKQMPLKILHIFKIFIGCPSPEKYAKIYALYRD